MQPPPSALAIAPWVSCLLLSIDDYNAPMVAHKFSVHSFTEVALHHNGTPCMSAASMTWGTRTKGTLDLYN